MSLFPKPAMPKNCLDKLRMRAGNPLAQLSSFPVGEPDPAEHTGKVGNTAPRMLLKSAQPLENLHTTSEGHPWVQIFSFKSMNRFKNIYTSILVFCTLLKAGNVFEKVTMRCNSNKWFSACEKNEEETETHSTGPINLQGHNHSLHVQTHQKSLFHYLKLLGKKTCNARTAPWTLLHTPDIGRCHPW